jgi:hypothetical protein
MQSARVSQLRSNRARCAWHVAETRLGVKAERCGVVAAAKSSRAARCKGCSASFCVSGGGRRCRHLNNRRFVDLLHLVRPHNAFCRLGGGRRGGCSGLASSAALAGRRATRSNGRRLADAQQRAQHRAGLLRALLLLLRRRDRRRRRLRLWFRLHARLLLLRRLRLRRCGALLRLRLHARLRQARLHIGITWRNRRRLPQRHDGCARAAQRQQRCALRPAMAASALRANKRHRQPPIRPGSCLAVPAFDVVGAQRGG